VDVEVRMVGRPAVDQRRLVRAGVVNDEVDVEPSRHCVINRIEKSSELSRPGQLAELADDLAALGVPGRKERRRAVAL